MIYFIRAGARGPIKIGFATDVAARMAALQTASPAPLKLVGAIPGGLKLEKQLHAELAEARLSGEWFSPTVDVRRWAQLARVIDGRHPEEIDPTTLREDARKAFSRLRLLPEGPRASSRRAVDPMGDEKG